MTKQTTAFTGPRMAGSGPEMEAEITPRFANTPKLRRMGLAEVLAAGPCYKRGICALDLAAKGLPVVAQVEQGEAA